MSICLRPDEVLSLIDNTEGIGLKNTEDPEKQAGKGYLYAKDLDGYSELFYMDNSGAKVRLAGRTLPYTETGTVQTTDINPTTAFTLSLYNNQVVCLKTMVIVVNSALSKIGVYERQAAIKCVSGTATLIGPTRDTFTEETDSNMVCTITANSNQAKVTVTGLAATTLDWHVSCEIHVI
jgi:hypothetical protein